MLTVNDFLKDNALWIALALVALLLLIVGIIFLSGRHRKQTKKQEAETKTYEALIEALGGLDNILSSQARGSRLILTLKDYQFDAQKLEALGVSSLIQMSDRITLVVGPEAQAIHDYLARQNPPAQ